MDHKMIDNASGVEVMPEPNQEWHVIDTFIQVSDEGKVTVQYLVDLTDDNA